MIGDNLHDNNFSNMKTLSCTLTQMEDGQNMTHIIDSKRYKRCIN